MREIYLHGAPGRAFGRRWRLDVSSPAEAVRALMTLRPALREVFRKGYWRVIVGRPHIRNGVDAACLHMNMGEQALHIVPATPARGSDAGNIGIIVVGVIMIAVATFLTWGAATAPTTAGVTAGWGAALGTTSAIGLSYGSIILLGVSLVATGMMGLLTPSMKGEAATDMAGPDDRPSFFFNGVVNNTQQGGPVPLVFGTHLVGSVVVSGSLNAEQMPVPPTPLPPWSEGTKPP